MTPEQIQRDFIDVKCRPNTLRSWGARLSNRRAVEQITPQFSGTLLDVGSGYQPYRELILSRNPAVKKYIALDFADNSYAPPDLVWEGKVIPLPDASVDCAMATEVLEHTPDPGAVLAEIHRVLRPGGILFFTVPFLWPLHCTPYDEYRYTPFALERIAKGAGFAGVEVRALDGYHGALSQMIALWVWRPGVGRVQRAIMKRLVWPIVYALYNMDRPLDSFKDNSMCSRFEGVCRKHRAE